MAAAERIAFCAPTAPIALRAPCGRVFCDDGDAGVVPTGTPSPPGSASPAPCCDDGDSMLMSLSQLPPEKEEGNREYKLKLVRPSAERLEHLVTQMKWRLAEGNGEALYEIGVADCGRLEGLHEDELASSLETLSRMALRNGALVQCVRRKSVGFGWAAEVVVARPPQPVTSPTETRVAVLGSADAGKSTLLGVLAHGDLDNGRGKARLNLFRHKHEIQSGRTSCVSHIVIGFDSDGNALQGEGGAVTLGGAGHAGAWDAPSMDCAPCDSPRLVACSDLAGHEKYLNTTVTALTGLNPDYALLVVAATAGIPAIAREHLGLAVTLGIPVAIAITKADCASECALRKTKSQLVALAGRGSAVSFVDGTGTADVDDIAEGFMERRVTPVFVVSSVTGANIGLLRRFLGRLRHRLAVDAARPPEFRIDDAWNVTGVGAVVSGTLQVGQITPGDVLALGPRDDGSFVPVSVGSIHRQRRPSGGVGAGQMAALSLQGVAREHVRRGMVLCSPAFVPPACFEFEAEVLVLCREAAIAPRYQAIVHCRGVRQAAYVVQVAAPDGVLRHGQRATVRLRFVRRPECIAVGAPLVLVSSRTKASGVVTHACPVPLDGGDAAQACPA